MKISLNKVVGDHTLCAWQPVKGITWVQTRDPKHAKRMMQRADAKLVVAGVAGGYLKTFEFRRSLPWAQRLMARYVAAEKVTNAASNRAICPVKHFGSHV